MSDMEAQALHEELGLPRPHKIVAINIFGDDAAAMFEEAIYCVGYAVTYVELSRGAVATFTFEDGFFETEGRPVPIETLVTNSQFVYAVTPCPPEKEDDAAIQALADEAEAGYDVDKLIPRIHPNAVRVGEKTD